MAAVNPQKQRRPGRYIIISNQTFDRIGGHKQPEDGRVKGGKDGRMEGEKDGRMEGGKEGRVEGGKGGRREGRLEERTRKRAYG